MSVFNATTQSYIRRLRVISGLVAIAIMLGMSLAAFPIHAYAADIQNAISATKSVKVNSQATIKANTVYKMWGIGPAGIPFQSDWRVEVSAKYFGKPSTYAKSGAVGSWKKKDGAFTSGKQWVQQSKLTVFYGETKWYSHSKAKALKTTKGVELWHGQHDALASGGYDATCKVVIKK